jgi:hypothetical protein
MRDLADEVSEQGADGVIMIGEMWKAAADPDNPYKRAADAVDKREVLGATLVRKTGGPVQLTADLCRQENSVRLGDTQISKGGQYFLFEPIYEVWGRAIHAD